MFGCFNEFSRCNVESRENIFILVMTMAHMSDVEKMVLVSPPLKNLLNLIK